MLIKKFNYLYQTTIKITSNLYKSHFNRLFSTQSIHPRGKLMIVPTPIGNLNDLSPKVIQALFSADIIGCEDRRIAGQLYHLIKRKNLIQQIQSRFGSIGVHSIVEANTQEEQTNKLHQFYNYSEMSDKQKKKFLRKKTIEEQQQFRIQFLKYRALGKLRKQGDWTSLEGRPQKYDQLYGIDVTDMKHIQIQIKECRKKKGRGLLVCLNTYNQTRMFDMVMAFLENKKIALVSDAGMPCISDPGWKLVQKIRQKMPSVPIQVIGGPSSTSIMILQAALASNKNSLSGRFQGFSSLTTGNFQQNNYQMKNLKSKQFSISFINANKLKKKLLQIQKIYGPNQMILLNNQLTKKHERKFHGTISELLQKIDDPSYKPVGEVSYLLYPKIQQQEQTIQKDTKNQQIIQNKQVNKAPNIFVKVSISHLLKALQKHDVKLKLKDQCDFVSSVFKIKHGQARKYVYKQRQK